MYGNNTLPGFAAGTQYRDENSIWLGYPESTSFKNVKLNVSDNDSVNVGTILKEDISDGNYSPFTENDIISAATDLPSVRLGIIADFTAKTSNTTQSTVLIGISGQVDKNKLFIQEKSFTQLSQSQQVALNTQLEAWGFQLVDVLQA